MTSQGVADRAPLAKLVAEHLGVAAERVALVGTKANRLGQPGVTRS